jgi:hypothetical protein
MAFDPAIMTHERVAFATTNNSYDQCVRSRGADGLSSLFATVIERKRETNWRAFRGMRTDELPTCEQAEVLYPGEIPTSFLRRVYVREEEHQDQVAGWLAEFELPHVETVWSPGKFLGKPN